MLLVAAVDALGRAYLATTRAASLRYPSDTQAITAVMHIIFHLEKLNFLSTFITRIAEFLIFQFSAAARVDDVSVISENTLLRQLSPLLLPLQVAPFAAAVVVDMLLLTGVRFHHSKLLCALPTLMLLLSVFCFVFFCGNCLVLLLGFVSFLL